MDTKWYPPYQGEGGGGIGRLGLHIYTINTLHKIDNE